MRTLNGFLFVVLAITNPSIAQTKIQGTWEGVLKPPSMALHIVLHVSRRNGALSATTDSPDQKAYGMAVDSIALSGLTLHFSQARSDADFKGTLSGGKIIGTFTQHGFSLPLTLTREQGAAGSNSGTNSAHSVVGAWEGTLHLPPPPPLHIVLHITGKNGSLRATTDSPDQGWVWYAGRQNHLNR
jgi:hypothetical protein